MNHILGFGGGSSVSSSYGAPQQPLVVTVNAPKWSEDDVRKNFWMKVAGGTFSFVAGTAIVGFAAFKIFPKEFFSVFTQQLHKSLLENLDHKGIQKLLDAINSERFVTNQSKAKKLKTKWGHISAQDILADEKRSKSFFNDVAKHVKLTNLITTWTQQIGKQTLTQEFADNTVTPFAKRVTTSALRDAISSTVSHQEKQLLLEKVIDEPEIQAILKKTGFFEKGKKLSALEPDARDQVLEVMDKHLSHSDYLSVLTSETGLKAGKDMVITNHNVDKAIESPSVQAALKKMGKKVDEMSSEDKVTFAKKHLSKEDFGTLLKNNGQDLVKSTAGAVPGLAGWLFSSWR